MEAQPSTTILDYATPKSRFNLKRFFKPLLRCLAIITLTTLVGMMVGRAFTWPLFRANQVLYIRESGSFAHENLLWTCVEKLNSSAFQNGIFQQMTAGGVIPANAPKEYSVTATVDRLKFVQIGVTGENTTIASSIAQAMQQAINTSLVNVPAVRNVSIDVLESNTIRLSSWKRLPVALGMIIGCLLGVVFVAIKIKRLAFP
ncbi:MAG TPA: hypothetical protein VHD56_03390 [Tepidisphaeraceae bacterium]|nr:hypothetical protein [Tepidisphaeraceae bacterium]